MRQPSKSLALIILALIAFVAMAMGMPRAAGIGQDTRIIAWGQYVSPYGDQPPGNSIEAILHSQQFDYDGIELDVQLSKDGHVVLMHDSSIDRTSNGTGLVSDYTLAELRTFSLGKWQGLEVRIPTLAEALDQYKGGIVLIDWRHGPGFESSLTRAVTGHNVIVSAHDRHSAILIKRAMPDIKVFLKTYQPAAEVHVGLARGLDGLMLNGEDGISDELLSRIRDEGLELITFVHEEHWGRWHLWKQIWQGVDYVLTRKPDWAKQFPV